MIALLLAPVPAVNVVISTTLKHNGNGGHPDQTLNCKGCYYAFSGSVSSKTKVQVHLNPEQLCDGISYTSDDYGEECFTVSTALYICSHKKLFHT
ncbi:hypothetical protein OESDEN_19641 [Oesophagostomum dentatum]|uniref:Uncharacterized protein n=1 Tax=Oesophagostomum dentatum TaxID=61180 RepID=A0A0B1SBW4_OESDE|nr:hypothetical protein OESDEN_19641 [Oesophagostomum dentatum]